MVFFLEELSIAGEELSIVGHTIFVHIDTVAVKDVRRVDVVRGELKESRNLSIVQGSVCAILGEVRESTISSRNVLLRLHQRLEQVAAVVVVLRGRGKLGELRAGCHYSTA
jgi:hypothetical protein